jgi:hypothetical protein
MSKGQTVMEKRKQRRWLTEMELLNLVLERVVLKQGGGTFLATIKLIAQRS